MTHCLRWLFGVLTMQFVLRTLNESRSAFAAFTFHKRACGHLRRWARWCAGGFTWVAGRADFFEYFRPPPEGVSVRCKFFVKVGGGQGWHAALAALL